VGAPVTAETITRAQLLRLRDELLEEMRHPGRKTAAHRRLARILAHVTVALRDRRPLRGVLPEQSLAAAVDAWNARHPTG
jgi:hypothetical protein